MSRGATPRSANSCDEMMAIVMAIVMVLFMRHGTRRQGVQGRVVVPWWYMASSHRADVSARVGTALSLSTLRSRCFPRRPRAGVAARGLTWSDAESPHHAISCHAAARRRVVVRVWNTARRCRRGHEERILLSSSSSSSSSSRAMASSSSSSSSSSREDGGGGGGGGGGGHPPPTTTRTRRVTYL